MELDICMQDFLNVDTFPTDLDAKFIDSFTELYLPIGNDGLRKLEAYCRGVGPGKNTEVLLALYIEVLTKMAKLSGAMAFEASATMEFLRENEKQLLDTGSAILKQLVFQLLADMESLELGHPFKFDINAKVHELLSADETNIYVRRAVENLAIVHLENMVKQGASSDFLLWNLVESILEADYALITDSISRVLIRFSSNLSSAQCEKLVQKAKGTKKAGLMFARLIAQILANKECGNLLSISNGFSDFQTHVLLVSELIEYNRGSKKFAEMDLLDLLVQISKGRFNFIAPHLKSMQFSSAQNAREFLKTLLDSLRHPRLCSDQNVAVFLDFLRDVDKEMELYPMVLDALNERIMKTPSLLKSFADKPASLNSGESIMTFERIFSNTDLRKRLSDVVVSALIDRSDGVGWEERDTALEFLEICGAYLDCDMVKLRAQLFHLAAKDESHFVRSSATKSLMKMFAGSRNEMNSQMQEELEELERVELEANGTPQSQAWLRRDMQAEIEDIISTMQNNCGLDDCVSKECY